MICDRVNECRYTIRRVLEVVKIFKKCGVDVCALVDKVWGVFGFEKFSA